MKKSVKIIIEIILFLLCVLLVDLIVKSIMKPVNFNKQKAYRESVAIQRLKDIRTLQVAYKGVNGKFTSTVDSLVDFYNNGKMGIVMQVGSMDDSLAMAHTEKIKKASRKKMTYKEKREFEQLEKDLEALNAEKEALSAKMNSGALDYGELQAASERFGALSEEIDGKELRWLELSELQ